MGDYRKQMNDAQYVILIPVFNEWEVLPQLLSQIAAILSSQGLSARVLLVDDGSTTLYDNELNQYASSGGIDAIDVLELGRNLGHQRAIAVGICYVAAKNNCSALIIMDGDGEDDPSYLPELINKLHSEKANKIIFAQRMKRSEGFLFRLFYTIYRRAYFIATGKKIRFGNYCIIPKRLLPKVVLISEIWSHFSAGILKSKIVYTVLPTVRGKRLQGKSKMNFVALVQHGLSAIAVNADVLGVRALIVSTSVMIISILLSFWVVGVRLFTDLAIPGWASTLLTMLILLFMNALSVSLIFIFMILNANMYQKIIPKIEYRNYIERVFRVFPRS